MSRECQMIGPIDRLSVDKRVRLAPTIALFTKESVYSPDPAHAVRLE